MWWALFLCCGRSAGKPKPWVGRLSVSGGCRCVRYKRYLLYNNASFPLEKWSGTRFWWKGGSCSNFYDGFCQPSIYREGVQAMIWYHHVNLFISGELLQVIMWHRLTLYIRRGCRCRVHVRSSTRHVLQIWELIIPGLSFPTFFRVYSYGKKRLCLARNASLTPAMATPFSRMV